MSFLASTVAGSAWAGAFDTPKATVAPSRPAMLDRPAALRPGAERELLLGAAKAGRRLVAVGASGNIVLSDDNGRSWRAAKSVPTSATLTAVRFSTERDGWAVGHLGVVLVTHDAGETWRLRLDGVQAARLMLQEAEARVARDGSEENQTQLKLAKLAVTDGPNKPFLTLVTEGPQHALVLGAFGLALETSDDGNAWSAASDRFENPKGQHYYAYAKTGSVRVVVGEQGLLLRSTDGKQFRRVESPYPGTLFGVVARLDGAVVAYGLRGNAIQSSDHGASWTKVASGVPASIQAGSVLADGSIVLASETGQMVRSRDGGKGFESLSKQLAQPVAELVPLDDKSLLIVGPRGAERVDLNAESGK